ncbi:protein of unknown function [Paraburkholderia kururiensis]
MPQRHYIRALRLERSGKDVFHGFSSAHRVLPPSLSKWDHRQPDALCSTFFALATIFARLKRLQTHGIATHFAPDDRPRPRHHRDRDA